MYTTKQIIENQNQYKDEILKFVLSDIRKTKKSLREINSNDAFIIKEKNKLLSKFKKLNSLETIKKYFFENSKRDDTFYVWWDVQQKEALILKYGKK